MVLSSNNEEVASSKKNIPNSRLECTNHTLFQTKMVDIDTLFQTKTAKKTIPFGAAHTYIAYIRESPPRRGGKKLVADYESRCETNKVNLNFTVTERLGCEVHNCNSRNAGSVRLEIAITSNKY